MNIVVNEELKAYIEPLTPEEHDALERSILTEGCRDALVLWGDVLVDGHNRYGICQKHGLPFQTVQNPRFKSMEDVHLWMIDQHLGRRSVSDFQRGVLALRKREIIADRKARAATAAEPAESTAVAEVPAAAPEAAAALPAPDPLSSREAIAKAARLSSSQVVMIEKIQKQAAPELVAAVKSGTISINAAAAVATLPAEEQVAAVVAGKDELKQAAKRVRELTKRKPREEIPQDENTTAKDAQDSSPGAAAAGADELQALRARVAELTAENTELRRQVAQLQAALPQGSTHF
ncbi:MAG: plasmid replication/partition related protein [Acidovorax sp.]|uniref:plasmid replication/partition related protein n=1 Tax=Acidovorax sp. TaxID=1872122 RepID=UPI00262F14EE|nr:plasmid replication/partition related protein [Acidovorax sp.]MDH4416427.1 plasmid replication/partition related protein [Acidovorax sp.]